MPVIDVRVPVIWALIFLVQNAPSAKAKLYIPSPINTDFIVTVEATIDI